MYKSRILQKIESMPEEWQSLTLREVKEKIIAEDKRKNDEAKKSDEDVVKRFKGKYIKTTEYRDIVGAKTSYFKIDDIGFSGFDTSWERNYYIKGQEILISFGSSTLRKPSESMAGDSKSLSELNSCEFVTEKHYKKMLDLHHKMEGLYKEMLK